MYRLVVSGAADGGMIGRSRKDSSTIRAIPSASGDARSIRNFSINSSPRSEESGRSMPKLTMVWDTAPLSGAASAPPPDSPRTGVESRSSSSGTPRAREIRRSVPACGLLVFPHQSDRAQCREILARLASSSGPQPLEWRKSRIRFARFMDYLNLLSDEIAT